MTHTPRFAAACAVAGIYNRISNYLSDARGCYMMYHSERIQGRMGGTLWDVPGEYIENSAVLKTDKVETPLLLVHGKDDGVVDPAESIQFFNALRRLGKRAWLLLYDGQGHSLDRGKTAEDFHTRMMQFFDHYLKDKPAPKWMTRGIPARMKGIDDGLELDPDIQTPGPGLPIQEWNRSRKTTN